MRKETPESRAWRIVAEEFAARRTSPYLCFAAGNHGSTYNARVAGIPYTLRQSMRRFIEEQLDGTMCAYPSFLSFSDEARGGRLTALLLFAEMAKDGRAAINA